MKVTITAVVFQKDALAEYRQWSLDDSKVFAKINNFIDEILRDPFHGTGKPEPLKYDLAGYWSRRITDEHRLVYKVAGAQLIIHSCKFHYQ
ncbi:toxin YoeB [Spirochaetia bacterium]|nr:toxin YoeB [Spirochaetia bacterium]